MIAVRAAELNRQDMRSIDVFIEANRRQAIDIEIIKVMLTSWK
jgi:hypothetical protein